MYQYRYDLQNSGDSMTLRDLSLPQTLKRSIDDSGMNDSGASSSSFLPKATSTELSGNRAGDPAIIAEILSELDYNDRKRARLMMELEYHRNFSK